MRVCVVHRVLKTKPRKFVFLAENLSNLIKIKSYKRRFIEVNVQNVPFWLSHKQEDALATGVCCVDYAQVDSLPNCNNAFTQYVDVGDGLLIHAFLN